MCLSLAQLFLLCNLMTVVVHSFVADNSLLDCCDLVVFFFVSTLCLQVGNRLGFWSGFSCFVSFIWCQLFACLIRAAIFRLPPAFVVWSFFLCHRHLWSVLSFFATVHKIALSEVLTTQMGMTEAQHQSQLIWIVQIWPIFASWQVDSAGTHA